MFSLRSAARPLARLYSTAAEAAPAASAAASSSSSPIASAASSSAPTSAPLRESESFAPRYAVERTHTGALPVYTDIRNGGNNVRTVVRRVTGNAQALRADLEQYLADGHIDPLRAPPNVVLKPQTRQLEVKGRWVEEIKGWLAARGF